MRDDQQMIPSPVVVFAQRTLFATLILPFGRITPDPLM